MTLANEESAQWVINRIGLITVFTLLVVNLIAIIVIFIVINNAPPGSTGQNFLALVLRTLDAFLFWICAVLVIGGLLLWVLQTFRFYVRMAMVWVLTTFLISGVGWWLVKIIQQPR